ncbi:hypothetical protein BCV69DRAFT_299914 [Microstroma glucosiphilum]|uniref:Uncharacterized protein n=1 Tax=Pseudomicrostroma glucosiphilum TaxID=1684307 RepID=A0A316UAW0_9BASI|nr:hypothetical protein BCV69DRAFT_299914 [Pseudomicrostroma glucosiphilum]PWN20175.1 hypothetical protein BCV69DRAFT_299914 [Pseudomicrostroma glucosiphilum]
MPLPPPPPPRSQPVPPRLPLRNWAAAFAAVAILPTGFLLGSYIHERTHEEPISREKLAASEAQQHKKPSLSFAETPEQKEATRLKKEQEQQALERERRIVQLRWELEDVTSKMQDVKSRGWDTSKRSHDVSGSEQVKTT